MYFSGPGSPVSFEIFANSSQSVDSAGCLVIVITASGNPVQLDEELVVGHRFGERHMQSGIRNGSTQVESMPPVFAASAQKKYDGKQTQNYERNTLYFLASNHRVVSL